MQEVFGCYSHSPYPVELYCKGCGYKPSGSTLCKEYRRKAGLTVMTMEMVK